MDRPNEDGSYYWIDKGASFGLYIGLMRQDYEGSWYVDNGDSAEFLDEWDAFRFYGPIPEPPTRGYHAPS